MKTSLPQSRRASSGFSTMGDAIGAAPLVSRNSKLRIPPTCHECHNRGYRDDGTPCSCHWHGIVTRMDEYSRKQFETQMRANREDELKRKLVIPAHYKTYTLDNHPLRGTEVYRTIRGWLREWDMQRGLILTGDYGVGKTSFIIGILQALKERAVDEGWSMRFITALDFLNKLQAGFDDGSYIHTLHEYSTVQVLALDDLCAERATAWRQDQFLALLNARYTAALPLLATTNCSEAELRERLTERVYWRLVETCDVYPVIGRNLRDA